MSFVAGDAGLMHDLKLQAEVEVQKADSATDEPVSSKTDAPNEIGSEVVDAPTSEVSPARLAREDAPDGAELLALFGDPTPVYKEFEVLFKDKLLVYYVKQLSPQEGSILDARMTRLARKAITILDSDLEESHQCGLAISEMLFRKSGETTDGQPIYDQAFSYVELVGQKEKKDSKGKVVIPRVIGLFERTGDEELAFTQRLMTQSFYVNRSADPRLKKIAEQMMMGMASAQINAE